MCDIMPTDTVYDMNGTHFRRIIVFIIAFICVLAAFQLVEWSFTRADYYEGDAYLRNGDYDKAIHKLGEVVRRDESNYLAYEELGIAYFRLNNADKAIEEFNASIYFKPDRASAYYNRGLAFLKKNAAEKAILDFKEAAEFNPEDVEPRVGLGLAYCEENRFDEAIYEYGCAIVVDRKSVDAYYNRGLAYYLDGDYDKAINDYTSSIQLDPKNGNIYRERGYCHYCKKEWHQAIEDFETAIKLNPEDSLAKNNYAWLLATCPDAAYRNGARAVELALKACQLTGWKQWISVDSLAAAYAEVGDFAQAIKYQMQVTAMKSVPESGLVSENRKLELYKQHKSYQASNQRRW
jgi:tetratricopeptide (TPR) repeat protein